MHSGSHGGASPAEPYVRLRILETTDLHASLLPYDYFADRPAPSTGLAHAATLIRLLQSQADNCLLFDNGDFLQGNPLADWIAAESNLAAGDLHPVIGAMNLLGYDAGTLGNHEFDYGLEFLTNVIGRTSFPLVSANTFRSIDGGPEPIVPPFVILDRQFAGSDGQRHLLRIGVIGFAPPTLVKWNGLVLRGSVTTCDIVTAAEALVPQMLAAGADLVVALCHSGIGDAAAVPDMEDAAVPLAGIAGIDIILTGHTHMVFPGPAIAATSAVDPVAGRLHGKAATMAGSNGSHVGVIDLTLGLRQGKWQILQQHSAAMPVAGGRGDPPLDHAPLSPDPAIVAAAAPTHAAILTLIREPLGSTAVPLHSYFALVGPDPTLQVAAAAQAEYGRHILKGSPWEKLPVLSAVSPSKAGGLGGPLNYIDIAPGQIAQRHAAELCVFPNSLCLLDICGSGLMDWLEHAAGQFCQITPGLHDQPLIDPGFPSYNFDVIAGLTYQIDVSQPCRTNSSGQVINAQTHRIADLRHDGRPVGPDQRFIIATNSYRVGGGGNFHAAQTARLVHHSQQTTREILTAYLRNPVPLDLTAQRIWRFATLPGTKAWFHSSPAAAAFVNPRQAGPIQLLRPREPDPAADGFARYSLDFSG